MNDDVVRLQAQLRMFFRRLRSEQPAVAGLSRGAVRLLHEVAHAGGCATPSAVADRLGMASSNVAPILRELEVAGYVSRARDREDARRVNVTMTEHGREALGRSRAGRDEWLRTAIAEALDDDERALLFAAGDLLERIASAPRPVEATAHE